jgi:hypothetical protein
MNVDGLGQGRDFKLWPSGGREWDWRETGMHHSPGISPDELDEVVENGAEVVVLSRGMLKRLEVTAEAISWLENRGLSYHIEPTKKAVKTYNRLAGEGVLVGGLFHSTC